MQKDHLVGGDGGGARGHTPGPWWVAESGVRDSGGYIAFSVTTTHWPDQDERHAKEVLERKANMHLCAAAPELLAMLRIHHEHCMNTQEGYSEHGSDAVAFSASAAAIAKAQGGAA